MTILHMLRQPTVMLSPIDSEKFSRWIFVLTNLERGRHGLLPLQRHPKLDRVAAFHCENMANLDFFSHVDPAKRGPQDRLNLLHPELIGSVGENIAMVSAGAEEELARNVVEGWMNSPGHRRNILSCTYSHLGVGLYQSAGCVFATQCFAYLYVELLDRRPPIPVRLDETCILRFYFFSSFERSDLALLLELPNPKALMACGNGTYFKGACPQKILWETGQTFRLTLTFSCGQGTYKLFSGRASQSRYCPAAMRFEVT